MPKNWNKTVSIQEAKAAYAVGDDLGAYCFLYEGDRVRPVRITVSGDIVTLPPYVPPVTLYTKPGRFIDSLIADIVPVQSGSGDPSPNNVRPISGWAGISLQRARKNLLDDSLPTTNIAVYGLNGGPDTKPGWYIRLPQGVYTISKNSEAIASYIYGCIINADGSYSSSFTITTSTNVFTKTITLTGGQYLAIYKASGSGSGLQNAMLQIEVGLTSTSYKPYSGQTYNVDWTDTAGTVYGGTLDVTMGMLMVNRRMITLDGTIGSWNADVNIPYWRINPASVNKPAFSKRAYVISNQYHKYTEGASTDKAIRITSDNNGIYVYDSRFVDSATAVSLLSESPVEICYPLLTAKTYQLTPTDVKTLLKQNNIFADTGDIASVEYVADTKTYIDNKFAELQALVLENT